MSQPPAAASPLNTRLYNLEYPRSLGVYSTYQEVQAVVDTLADNAFPVQRTMIVGTDLKLMERVTGRKTWGKVIGQGVLSGLWMGLFLGLLLMFISQSNLAIVVTSVLMGIVFFTVWSAVGYAMTGGKRDFTSMVATIPMQYELMVEHTNAEEARRILAEAGAAPPQPTMPHSTVPGQPDPCDQSGLSGPTGQSSPGPGDGRPSYGQPGPSSSPASGPSRRPTYGKPAPSQAPATPTQQPPADRPSFGQPDHSEDTSPSEQRDGAPGTGFDKPAPSQAPATPTQQPPADRPSFGQPDHSEDTSPSEQRDGTPGTGYGRLSAEYGQSGRVYGYSGPEYGQPGQQQGDHTDDRQTAQDSPDDPR